MDMTLIELLPDIEQNTWHYGTSTKDILRSAAAFGFPISNTIEKALKELDTMQDRMDAIRIEYMPEPLTVADLTGPKAALNKKALDYATKAAVSDQIEAAAEKAISDTVKGVLEAADAEAPKWFEALDKMYRDTFEELYLTEWDEMNEPLRVKLERDSKREAIESMYLELRQYHGVHELEHNSLSEIKMLMKFEMDSEQLKEFRKGTHNYEPGALAGGKLQTHGGESFEQLMFNIGATPRLTLKAPAELIEEWQQLDAAIDKGGYHKPARINFNGIEHTYMGEFHGSADQ